MSESKLVDGERLGNFIRNVRQEIANMQAGESQYRVGGLHFEKNTSPALSALTRLQEQKSKVAMDSFLALATQDFGRRAGDAFKTWSQGIYEELTDEGKPVVVLRGFEVRIKDGFYDLIKACRIPLEPKQITLLEQASLKMAGDFKKEIHLEVKTQLEALVAGIKKAETPPAPTPIELVKMGGAE